VQEEHVVEYFGGDGEWHGALGLAAQLFAGQQAHHGAYALAAGGEVVSDGVIEVRVLLRREGGIEFLLYAGAPSLGYLIYEGFRHALGFIAF